MDLEELVGNILRSIIENKNDKIKVVGINDLGSIETNAHLLKYDSVHGILNRDVIINGSDLDVGTGPIKVTSERNPENLPWKELDVDVVLECTGIFTSKEKAQQHITAGAKKVLISAPASGVDLTVVYGVNHKKISSEHQILSNASCTTNCLAPLAYVLNKSSAIAVNVIDKNNIHKYGVIKPKERISEIIKIEDIVEKPIANDAPSDLAVCGRYILNSSIFRHLKSVKPDKSDEIQLTDAIKSLLIEEEVYGVLYDGEKFDCGSKEGFVHATIALALRDESISENIKEIIRNID